MFHKKRVRRVLELNYEEVQLARYALMHFRNKLLEEGKPTEDVAELLLKIIK